MENKLEQLLNSLIEKGWKPFGRRPQGIKKAEQYVGTFNWVHWGLDYQKRATIRELVSKESGLWQFVCENGMVKKLGDNFKYFYNSRDDLSTLRYYEDRYKYWLLESALKDESELEDFLLNSIKLEGIS